MPKPARVKAVIPIWRKEDRADHIYRVAAQVMCHKGYEATSMNDIADAVGLTKAGIYHYIRGKEDLLFAIMTFGMDMIDQHVIAPTRQIAGAEERLRSILACHAGRILEFGGEITILLEEMPALTPVHERTVKSRKRAYFDLVKQTLKTLSAEGKLRKVDLNVATFSLLGMINWIPRWHRRGGALTPQEIVKDFVEIAMNSVVVAKAAGSPRPRRRTALHQV